MFDHITQLDEAGLLYISGEIHDWQPVHDRDISVLIDLERDIDHGVPTIADQFLYIYLPINDAELPNLDRLHAVVAAGAHLVKRGHRVLAHCGLGLNRSALVCGLILVEMGMPASDAIELLREKRQGALYNKVFASYLAGWTVAAD